MHVIYIREITDLITSAVDSYQDQRAYKMCVLQTLFFMKLPCWCNKYIVYKYSQSQPTQL